MRRFVACLQINPHPINGVCQRDQWLAMYARTPSIARKCNTRGKPTTIFIKNVLLNLKVTLTKIKAFVMLFD